MNESTSLTQQIISSASPDQTLIALWLHDRPETTQKGYRIDIGQFQAFICKPLPQVTLLDLQAYSDSLKEKYDNPTTIARKLKSVKSLLTFAYKIGYTPVNVGAPLRLPRIHELLAERIMSEEQVQRILAHEEHPRNHAILRLFYASGIRVSELCNLRWKDLQPRGDAGQITVIGKGEKERAVLVSAETWKELQTLKQGASDNDPVFQSRGGGHGKAGNKLDASQVLRIVRAAAERAGIDLNVSPHWLRHSHASHALDRGAPINLVRETLGHTSLATTGKYVHARPNESSGKFLPI